jgi:hypothetical protein
VILTHLLCPVLHNQTKQFGPTFFDFAVTLIDVKIFTKHQLDGKVFIPFVFVKTLSCPSTHYCFRYFYINIGIFLLGMRHAMFAK